jgi:hypothetical protein
LKRGWRGNNGDGKGGGDSKGGVDEFGDENVVNE